MQSIARAARLARPLARRTYATAAVDTLKLSLSLPHQAIFKDIAAVQVNIPAVSGAMGVLANHVPAIEQLKPGVVEVIEETGSKKYFLSGGFAVVHPGSAMTINAVEASPLEDFSVDAVREQIAEAQKAADSADETVAAEAKVELEVLEALQAEL